MGAAGYLTNPFDLDALIEKLNLYAMSSPPSPAAQDDELGISSALRRIEAQLPQLAAKARSRKGVFEQADGGTLFLDEIGDMPYPMQVKLLRVIQERRVTRVGGEKSIPVDLRLISATHQDLKKRVTQNLFREDLYYRLNVIQIHIPLQRQRREDILWLARRFLNEAAPTKQFSEEAEQALLTHDWPGNARELKHAVERGAILANGATVGVAALFGDEDAAEEAVPASLADFVAQSERRYIAHTLDECAGHLGHTADALGISRKNLWEKMKKLGLSVNEIAT